MLRIIGLAQPSVEARVVEQEELPVRENCECGGEKEFQYREAVLDEGGVGSQMPRVRTPGSLALALGGVEGSRTGVGAAETASAGEADVMPLGNGDDLHPAVSRGRRR